MAIQSYRDLDVWQVGMDIARLIHRETRQFPKEELYGLVSQMRRCGDSIPSNVAEGHARLSTGDFHHHVSIALGSLAELETQLILATDFGYLGEAQRDEALEVCGQLGRQLRALAKSLKAKLARKK